MKPLEKLLDSGDLIDWALTPGDDHTDYPQIIHRNNIKYSVVANGILLIEPEHTSHASVLLSCGIHGNETAPIELVEQVFKSIIHSTLQLNCRLLIVMGNQPAMLQNQRFCDENLNRLFKRPNATHDNLETQRAGEIMRFVDGFFDHEMGGLKVHLDLHTAIRGSKYEKFAIYPYQKTGQWLNAPMAWLAEAGIEAILLANKSSGTFSCYTDHYHGAVGFTVELGKARAFGDNDHGSLTEFKSALIDLLQHPELISGNDHALSCRVFNVVAEVIKRSEEGFSLNLSDDFSNFTQLEHGYQLTNDGDDSYVISGDEQAVVFPNKNVPVGQRVALVVEPYE